jgi:hypothetical protein
MVIVKVSTTQDVYYNITYPNDNSSQITTYGDLTNLNPNIPINAVNYEPVQTCEICKKNKLLNLFTRPSGLLCSTCNDCYEKGFHLQIK